MGRAKHLLILLSAVAAVMAAGAAGAAEPAKVYLWPSTPPEGCPFTPSETITGLGFTGRHKEYTGADTWYLTWASNNVMYSPFTDGVVEGVGSTSYGDQPTTGQAEILGSDPLNLTVRPLGTHVASAAPYGGRYPCGSLVHNGVWYYGTYCLDNGPLGLNWEVLGPFVGFRISRDLGRTWTDTPHTPAAPLFGESGKSGGKV